MMSKNEQEKSTEKNDLGSLFCYESFNEIIQDNMQRSSLKIVDIKTLTSEPTISQSKRSLPIDFSVDVEIEKCDDASRMEVDKSKNKQKKTYMKKANMNVIQKKQMHIEIPEQTNVLDEKKESNNTDHMYSMQTQSVASDINQGTNINNKEPDKFDSFTHAWAIDNSNTQATPVHEFETVVVKTEPDSPEPMDVNYLVPEIVVKTERISPEKESVFLLQSSKYMYKLAKSSKTSSKKSKANDDNIEKGHQVSFSATLSGTDSENLNKNSEPIEINTSASENTYTLTESDVLEACNNIYLYSSNKADKILAVEARNIIGVPKKAAIEQNINELKLQNALDDWKNWSSGTHRTCPLFYKCYMCMEAWWYLSDFRKHIYEHYTDIKIALEKTAMNECNIIAYDELTPKQADIMAEGVCWQCGKDYDFHKLSSRNDSKHSYVCKGCKIKFFSCLSLRRHELLNNTCTKEVGYTRCTICPSVHKTILMKRLHMILHHHVRSDVPAITNYKKCIHCGVKYIIHSHYDLHSCVSKPKNAACNYCFRSFDHELFSKLHMEIANDTFVCQICSISLPKKCMELEHILMHSTAFILPHRCIACNDFTIFLNEQAMEQHRQMKHKLKYDRKNNYFDKVLVPIRCVFPNYEVSQESQSTEILPSGVKLEVVNELNNVLGQPVNSVEQSGNVTQQPGNVIEVPVNMMAQLVNVMEQPVNMLTQPFTLMKKPVTVVTQPVNTLKHPTNVLKQPIGMKQRPNVLRKLVHIAKKPPNVVIKPVRLHEPIILPKPPVNVMNKVTVVNNIDEVIEQPVNVVDNIVEVTEQPVNSVEHMVEVVEKSVMKKQPVNEMEKSVSMLEKSVYVMEQPYSVLDQLNNIPKHLTEELIIKEEVYTDEEDFEEDIIKLDFTTCRGEEIDSDDMLNTLNTGKLRRDNRGRRSSSGKPKLYSCKTCGFTGTHYQYRLHQKSSCAKYNMGKYFKCTKCNVRYGTMNKYLKHFVQHNLKYRACPECAEVLETLHELQQHLYNHIKSKFLNLHSINADNCSMSYSKQPYNICKTCGREVKLADMFKHWEFHLEIKYDDSQNDTTDKPEMVYCDLPKDDLEDLIKLLQAEKKIKIRKCPRCARLFNRNNDCKRHLIEHLLMDAFAKKITNGALKCQICGSSFRSAYSYKMHMRVHGSMPVYRCNLCNKSFSDSSNFAKHKKHHNKSVLICDLCKKKFQMKVSLERHMQMHSVTKPVSCTVCPKVFHTQSLFKKHYRCAHSEKKYSCGICREKFSNTKDKVDHLWLVHRERKYEMDCEVCGVSFRKFMDLKKHVLKKHDLVVWSMKRSHFEKPVRKDTLN